MLSWSPAGTRAERPDQDGPFPIGQKEAGSRAGKLQLRAGMCCGVVWRRRGHTWCVVGMKEGHGVNFASLA